VAPGDFRRIGFGFRGSGGAETALIVAGENDRLIDIDEQSGRLRDEVKQSKMHRIAGAGHMVQQSATADLIAAIDEAAAAALH
jgi:pimeloyl-ACP methyl ester carboxylesterase